MKTLLRYLLLVFVALGGSQEGAKAQSYPSRPVTFVCWANGSSSGWASRS